METERLLLINESPERLRTRLNGAAAYEEAYGLRIADDLVNIARHIPPEFIEEMLARPDSEDWSRGFSLIHKTDRTLIGLCGFKSLPDAGRMSEIAYVVDAAYQGQGFATEAVRAITAHLLNTGCLRTVRAHTLPEMNASSAVLAKCGYTRIGEAEEPDDGIVWRWERCAALR